MINRNTFNVLFNYPYKPWQNDSIDLLVMKQLIQHMPYELSHLSDHNAI